MARGLNAATVVPTASDDCGEGAASRNGQAPSSDREEGRRYSSDAASNNNPATPITETVSGKYLEDAFNSQTSSSNSYPKAAFNGQASALPTTNGSGGSSIPLQLSKADKQKTSSPLVGKSLRQCSQSVVLQKQSSIELTKNYLEFVKDFRQLRPFTRRPDGKYPGNIACIYCSKKKPTSVFFPCQHMCVCNDCIQANNISTDDASPSNWSACPVCMNDIQLILPHTGKEEEKYWKWVLEIKPTLPSHFKQEFREAGKQLIKDVAPARSRRRSFVTMFCREGAFKKEDCTSTLPNLEAESSAPVRSRRHSWQPGEDSTVKNVAVSSEHDEAHNCSIL